jgi:uncharacterized protein
MRQTIERAFPAGSGPRERLLALEALYAGLEAHTAAFAASGLWRCPPGCGRCSAKFEPDVLPLEALFAALFVRDRGIDLSGLDARPSGRCPLFVEDNDRHCPVYPARPLVCRLFGFSSLPDKSGALAYTPCEHMEGRGRGTVLLSDLGLPEAALPPSMTEFSTRLLLIAPGEAGRRTMLRAALADAAGVIGLYERLAKEE